MHVTSPLRLALPVTLTAFLVALACPALPAAGPPRTHGLAARAQAVLRAHCVSCHGPAGKPKGGFGHVLDRDRLVAGGQVVPGRSGESSLYRRIVEGEMPPGKRARPSMAELAVLRDWVKAGAPPWDARKAPALLTESDVLRIVLADLKALPPRSRRFARYLTLGHLAGLPAEQLASHSHALAKLANSLSWHPRVRRPERVDPAGLVYRIDLRWYKWTPRQWDRLAAGYPYRLPEPGEMARSCARLAGAEQPYLRGDWFVALASRPPAYHDFLQLPTTDRALERLLLVDVPGGWQDDTAARAGFNGSGVARNNRLIERHDSAHGAYWRSYDFGDNTGRQNLFERPLGPLPGPHGFVHAGGEVIFHLPNGLQGYLLVDGEGRRVDKAPGEVVSDPKRPDRLVETGISCFGCHAQGLIPKDDQVRAHVLKNPRAFPRSVRDDILALYPPPAHLRRLMKQDVERYARALKSAGVPAGEPEPISAVTLRYEAVLDLPGAAAEVGLGPGELAARLRKEPELLKALGPLLARGGTVQRQVFEEAYPLLARRLRLGVEGGEWRVERAEPRELRLDAGAVRALAFSADGRWLATAGEDRAVRVWDVATGKESRRLEGHTDEVLAVTFSPDGKHVASGGMDRTVRVWDVGKGKEVRRLAGHTEAVRAVTFDPGGHYLLSAGEDRVLRLWDVAKGKEVRTLTGHAGAVTALGFAPGGRQALSAGLDRTVRLWDVQAGRRLGRWEAHTGEVYAVAFSPDGRRGVSGGADRVVRVWDVAAGKQVRALAGHAGAVLAVTFTPDGRRILSGGSESGRAARAWEADTGKEAGGAGKAEARAEAVAFTCDGSRSALAAGGVVRVVPVSK
jgi:mono/diheme cytochrome c family protein